MSFCEKLYQTAINDLFERHQSVQSRGFSHDSYKPGLEAMCRFDSILGSPSGKLKCLHVAGTNGKGSVCSMLASALSSAGFRVGLYTSPHLVDFRERIKIISKDSFELVPREYVFSFLGNHSSDIRDLSFFEITTGLAFKWFADSKVDYAVIETGLGGRLDSTNIINPVISVVTSIGLDHCAILGDTRAAIAAEKAGIFKKGIPAVVASSDGETSTVFRDVAEKAGAELIFADAVPDFPNEAGILSGLDLKGPCREMNLHTVLVVLDKLGFSGLDFEEGLKNAARRTGLRGRWEKLSECPEIICDIGHNPPALEVNFRLLEQLRGSGAARRPLYVVYGVMKDKDLDSIALLLPSDAEFFLCAPSTERAMDVDELRRRLGALRPDLRCFAHRSVAAAVAAATAASASTMAPIIYIGGSTFVVSEAISEASFIRLYQ